MTRDADALRRLIETVIQRVAELPDRTSPDDWPDAMLVTAPELETILSECLSAPGGVVGDRLRELATAVVVKFGYCPPFRQSASSE